MKHKLTNGWPVDMLKTKLEMELVNDRTNMKAVLTLFHI